MTLSEFKYVESEVISLLNQTLDTVKDKSFSDYVLLISRAGYQVENEGTFLSPYVLSSQLEVYQDITRERFSVEYLNSYANLLRDNIFMTDEVKEFNLNLQMMIYAQIWESHRLLKTLLRIGKILAGDPYEWKISFEYMNEKGKKKAYPKGKIMQDQILNGALILKTDDFTYILFLAMYGVDFVLTICHRIMLHENIGKPHRKHAYQLMANELKIGHVKVSSVYMLSQLAIAIGLILMPENIWIHWIYAISVIIILSAIYVIFMKKYYHLHEAYLATIKK